MLSLNFNPFPKIESDRLSFRSLHKDDMHEVFRLRSDEEIMKYIPRPLAKDLQDAMEHIRTVMK